PVSVNPGESLPLIVRFTRQAGQRGVVSDTLHIASNDPAPGPFTIVYDIVVDEAELSASLAAIDFPDVVLCEGNAVDATFDLVNTGTVPLRVLPPQIGDPAFSIVSPAPGVWPLALAPGMVLPIQLRVSHVAAGSISGSIRFTADDAGCNVESEIVLTARALDVAVEMETPGEFTRLQCFGEIAETGVVIRNIGDIEVLVTEITPPDPAFVVLSPVAPFPLAVGEEREVRIRFAPDTPGSYSGQLLVRIDRCDLRIERDISGTRDSIGLQLVPLDFGLQRAEMLPVIQTVRVVNSGSVPVTIASAMDMPPFRIVGGLPINLLPGAGADLQVQFDDPAVDGTFNEAIPLEVIPTCDVYLLDVTGLRGTASVELIVDTLSAEPGELVELRVYLRNANNLALFGASAIRASLRYRSSLLVPTADPIGTLVGDERVIDLTIPLVTDANDVALRLPFMVTLGDAEETALVLTDVQPVGGDLTVLSTNGHFTLLGICREGGTRLFDGGAQVQLKQNHPNPFNPVTEIAFVLIEQGQTRLQIHDAYGRLVATLADGQFAPGTHVRVFDAGGLPSGVYFAVLQTPTIVRQRRMLLMK
ncbi:MAG: T9SS type A sorting domain-containing protein, partial [Bacteroidetes bacterium]|nr:T9SS type A sorting domain-containing protein [Bacteroidota bacterium]